MKTLLFCAMAAILSKITITTTHQVYAQDSGLCVDGSTPDQNGNCPQPQQQTCPDGSTPDSNGNCPTPNQQSPPVQQMPGSIWSYAPYTACWYAYLAAGYDGLTAGDICAQKYGLPPP